MVSASMWVLPWSLFTAIFNCYVRLKLYKFIARWIWCSKFYGMPIVGFCMRRGYLLNLLLFSSPFLSWYVCLLFCANFKLLRRVYSFSLCSISLVFNSETWLKDLRIWLYRLYILNSILDDFPWEDLYGRKIYLCAVLYYPRAWNIYLAPCFPCHSADKCFVFVLFWNNHFNNFFDFSLIF